MVVTDYHKKRTMENIQKEGTMEFLTRWLCCTSKWSCELRSCDHISTYWSKKKEKCGPSAQECNNTVGITTGSCFHIINTMGETTSSCLAILHCDTTMLFLEGDIVGETTDSLIMS